MDCRQIQTLFTAYTDQELDQRNLLLFEQHLRSCSHCFEELECFQKILLRLRMVEPLTAPSGLLPGIHEKLARRGIGYRLGLTFKKIFAPLSLTAGASAMTVAVTIAFFTHTSKSPESPAVINDSLARQETRAPSSPAAPVASMNIDPNPGRRFSDQLLLTPSAFSGRALEEDRSPHSLYKYWLHGDQNSSGNALSWHLKPGPADTSLLMPQWHRQQIGMPLMPDVTIRVHHLSHEGLENLHRHVQEAGNWQTRCYHHDFFLVLLNPGEIDALYSLLQQHRMPFSSLSFHDADRLAQKPLLVAVRL
jgi:hypothetical protein